MNMTATEIKAQMALLSKQLEETEKSEKVSFIKTKKEEILKTRLLEVVERIKETQTENLEAAKKQIAKLVAQMEEIEKKVIDMEKAAEEITVVISNLDSDEIDVAEMADYLQKDLPLELEVVLKQMLNETEIIPAKKSSKKSAKKPEKKTEKVLGDLFAGLVADEPLFEDEPLSEDEAPKKKKRSVDAGLSPEERFSNIPIGTIFYCAHKETATYFVKTPEEILRECNPVGNLAGMTWQSSKTNPMAEAANYFREKASIGYNISGWEFLKPYNPETKKHISIKRWKGNIQELPELYLRNKMF